MSETMKQIQKLLALLGPDAVVVWKPEETGSHITSALCPPGHTKGILEDVVERM